MMRTALFKALDHFWTKIVDAFEAAELWHVVPPDYPQVSDRSPAECYCIDYQILVARGIQLSLTFELDKHLSHDVIENAAVETAKVISHVSAMRGEVLRMLESAQYLAQRHFETIESQTFGARLIGARLAPLRVDRPSEALAVEILYDGWDDRLRPSRRTILLAPGLEEATAVQDAIKQQSRRAERRELVLDAGGVGLIDTVSLSAIAALAGGQRPFLRQIVEGRPLQLKVPYGRGSATSVLWQDGVASVRISVDRNLSFGKGVAWVRRPGRDLDPSALAGTPLADIVRHAILPDELVIIGAKWNEGWPELRPAPDDQQLVLTYRESLRIFDHRGDIVGPPVDPHEV